MDEVAAAALLAGFRAHDAATYAAFFNLLIPAIRSRLKARWSSLKYARRDMEEIATTTIVEWRESGLIRDDDTFAEVVERLVKASALAIQRRRERDDKIADATAALPAGPPNTPEKALITNRMRQRVWDLVTTLEPKHQRVLEAFAQSEIEDKTMAEILGVSPDAAWKMAERARKAFSDAVFQAGLKASDFLETSE